MTRRVVVTGLGMVTPLGIGVAENWDALVEDDYTAVMPLPWKKKYSFRYVYQPLNCQQLGIFTTNPPARGRIQARCRAGMPPSRRIRATFGSG